MESSRKLKVIVYEDNHRFSEILSKAVKGLGHEVTILSDPTSCSAFFALDKECSQDAPCADVLLTHCVMANSSGIELFGIQSEHKCKIPVENKSLMSDDPSLKDLSSVKKIGCHFFAKPFAISDLDKWLNKCVGNIKYPQN